MVDDLKNPSDPVAGAVRPRLDRPRLDRARIVAAAMDLADSEGIATLSMRSLAARLGVVPMALYKHVASKEALLDAIVDEVIAGYTSHVAQGDSVSQGDSVPSWRDRVRQSVVAARREVVARPWLQEAIETRTTRSEVVLAHMDAVAGAFIGGGLSVDLTHFAMHALGNRLWGIHAEAFEPKAAPSSVGRQAPDSVEQAAAMRMMAERYPHVVAIASDAAARNPDGACDGEREFMFGVELLLDAFERLHEAGWTSGRG